MRYRLIGTLLIFALAVADAAAQDGPAPSIKESTLRLLEGISGQEVLDHSIAYHDPLGTWHTSRHAFRLFESRPGNPPEKGGNYRITDVTIDLSKSHFRIEQQRGPDRIVRDVTEEVCVHSLNGEMTADSALLAAFGLNCTGSKRIRNYYTYLWGLPMKLTDPGTLVGSVVHRVDFFGDALIQVKVTYEEHVGGDIWYFYFDPDSFALRGYRFYRDQAKNDGEYILLSGEATIGGLRVPQSRKWYMHVDGRYLGEDRIVYN